MTIKSILVAILIICSTAQAQNLKSPETFLGYKPGAKFTPHYKIAGYFEQAAAAMPLQMKLEQYGTTNEGKPLLLAIVTAQENFANLEEIRKNNLRLTGLLTDRPGDPAQPAVIWLSYNVHGNEASSSEVSMRTLYELLSPVNVQTKEWLKHVVVIIDPCLNPDGRDRYVNWYNQMEGKKANADPEAREHDEPWPGGRTNHYNFDLNRDWAWQTQVETQQRIIKYNEWMPVIHCDFHEQGYTNPYYFAPAAAPFHDAISSWQRSFQVTVGKNHARYFDARGWLYFTKEYFDLFYPAYGDTYPIYNGAIGMTYEQAGHSRAGLAVAIGSDTLTLYDRIEHHFTTSMSTIEIAANNYLQLNTEFKKYFDNGKTNGSGDYKSYVISGANENKLTQLKNLLTRNNITYSYLKQGTVVKGFNYFSGKEENYTSAKSDLLVSALQPKATLIRVLFEPKSVLTDSATYDITAWAIPYAYGIQTYAVKDKLQGTATGNNVENALLPVDQYAYLVEYNSVNDAVLLASMIKLGMKVRFAETAFSFNGKKFNRGTLIVLKWGNEKNITRFLELTSKNNNMVTAVSSGFMETGVDFGSDKLHMIKKPSVVLVTGDEASANAAGEVWEFFEQHLDYPLTLVNAASIKYIDLKKVDVMIIPDGRFSFFSDKDFNATLKTWVRSGGKIIAMENAVMQMATAEWGMKVKKTDPEKKEQEDKPSYADLKKYGNRERDYLVDNIPGAIYKIELDETHPLAFGYPSYYFSLKLNDNIYDFMKDAWNVGVIKKENQVSGFVGSKVMEKIKDGTVISVEPLGQGSVIYFADDPLFRGFWENGKLMFANAVFLVGQ